MTEAWQKAWEELISLPKPSITEAGNHTADFYII